MQVCSSVVCAVQCNQALMTHGKATPLRLSQSTGWTIQNLEPRIHIQTRTSRLWRLVTENNTRHMILKSCAWRLNSKCYVWLATGGRETQCFETLRLAGVWRNVLKSHIRRNISKSSHNFLISKRCVWLASGRCLTQCFEITRQMQHVKIRRQTQHFKTFRHTQFSVTVRQTCIMSGVVYRELIDLVSMANSAEMPSSENGFEWVFFAASKICAHSTAQ